MYHLKGNATACITQMIPRHQVDSRHLLFTSVLHPQETRKKMKIDKKTLVTLTS
jgi:hypothetical protein